MAENRTKFNQYFEDVIHPKKAYDRKMEEWDGKVSLSTKKLICWIAAVFAGLLLIVQLTKFIKIIS